MMNPNLIIDRLIELSADSSIAHHIPGRVRLKVTFSALLRARDLDLTELVDLFSGILEARVNPAARSVVIGYDPATIAPALWERLVDGKADPGKTKSMREELQKLIQPTGR